jgi:hypothetical protein
MNEALMYQDTTQKPKTQYLNTSDAIRSALPLLSSVPYFENSPVRIVQRQNQYRLSIHADVTKIKRLDAPPPPHGIHARAKVTGFSNKSRKRMIETLAMITTTPTLFATLTWSDDVAFIEVEDYKRHFELFRHWLEYTYPDIKAIYRWEWEKRKSGQYKGMFIPHVHLLIWLQNVDAEMLNSLLIDKGKTWREQWHKMIDSQHPDHLRYYGLQLEQIKSRRHAYHYASKYVAKANDDNLSVGRRWGRVGELDTLEVFEMDISIEEYIQLKRLIVSYAKKRKKWMGKKLARQSVKKGLTVFGLGAWNDINHGLETSTIVQMIYHAIELSYLREREKRNEQLCKQDTYGTLRITIKSD